MNRDTPVSSYYFTQVILMLFPMNTSVFRHFDSDYSFVEFLLCEGQRLSMQNIFH